MISSRRRLKAELPFQGVHRPAGPELAREKLECLHPEGRGLEIAVALEEFCRGGRRAGFLHPSQGDMRVEDSHIERKAGRKQRIVNLLSKLVKARMAVPDSHPDHAGGSAGREGSHAGHRQKKRLHLDPAKRGLELRSPFRVDISKKPQSQMELLRPRPNDARRRLVPRCELVANGRGQRNCDE